MSAGLLRTQIRRTMNILHKGITLLLRSAITGEKISLPEDFRLEDADELIRSQSLLPMAYLGAYNCGISPETELMRRYKQQYFRILLRHEQQMQAVGTICRAFEENGIDYALLKGCIMKPLYPNPEMRMMGDADILIRKEQYEKIRTVMKNIGFEEGNENICDISWVSKKLLTELHHRLYGDTHRDFLRYFDNIWEKAVPDSGNRYQLSVEDHYLHIFTHMTKHFRNYGIGSRQIVDLQVYRMAHPNMDQTKVNAGLKVMGLTDFHETILRLLRVWFEEEEETALTTAVTEYVLGCGTWGNTENSMQTDALIRTSGNTKKARKDSLFRVIFPKLSYMQPAYNILFRYPWLQPVFWVVRWVDILLHRRKNIGKRMGIIRDMSDEKISQRKAFLDAVGLKFYKK